MPTENYLDAYFDAVEDVLHRIRETQRAAIKQAAELLADAIAQRGVLAVMDTGHMLQHEAHLRAGGLLAFTPFAYDLRIETDMPQRKEQRAPEELAALEERKVALALDASLLKSGDVMLINSNSGRTPNVVEAALQCRERGIHAIALCSAAQSEACAPAHPSGQKLWDVADVRIDNCTPHGDAAVPVQDNEPMCPLSGLASAYIFWAIQADAVRRLQERGVQPSIYRSVHVGGEAAVEAKRQHFIETGI